MTVGVGRRSLVGSRLRAAVESAARPIPPTGNTNTHGIFKPDVRTFLKRWVAEGPTHHFALGICHHASELVEIAKILNLDYAVVTPFENEH
ncbi:MAG: hypothetical protein WC205_08810 [Opitutaceae bacterium]